MFVFDVGHVYSRDDVADLIGLAERLGNWTTGYHAVGRSEQGDRTYFIFANVGVQGRTGPNYPNRWDGKNLIWYGKTRDQVGKRGAIDELLSDAVTVHIFWRGSDRAKFTYAGRGTAISATNDQPTVVTWGFEQQVPRNDRKDGAAESGPVWRRGPRPRFGEVVSNISDGPTAVYLLGLVGGEVLIPGSKGFRVVKVGMSSDVGRRIAELNSGFPPGALSKWEVIEFIELPSGTEAWLREGRILERLRIEGYWIGGEFAVVPDSLVRELLAPE